MEKHPLIENSSLLTNIRDKEFDIRKYMKYDIICQLLIQNPTELALLEITCIIL